MEQVEKFNQIIDEVYRKYADSHFIPPSNPKGKLLSEQLFSVIPMEHSKESFINKCKIDSKFSKKWGIQIEERELSLEERKTIYENEYTESMEVPNNHWLNSKLTTRNIPTKLITLTYKNNKIESYE